ncbi:MAG TPA: DUF2070 family protein [Candidatus Thermoplasmatota archaeon]|nr:DUF2070 family protein [Candidatus Thermoplasmatota archaeon]
MAHLHAPGEEGENSLQESLEKSAQISKVVFNAPPLLLSTLYLVGASALFGLLLEPTLQGVLNGLLLIGAPGLVAAFGSAPLAHFLGGTLSAKRAAFLSAVCVTLVGATLIVGIPFRLAFGVKEIWVLVYGYMAITSVRHAVLFAISDNNHLRSLPVSLLQTLVALPLLAAGYRETFGTDEVLLTLLLPVVFLGPLIFFLEIFDTPLQRNFKVSGSEMFRFYLDHVTTGRMEGEEVLGRFAEPIRAKFGVVGFRRKKDQSLKAVIVVPAIHPGPIGHLGGSDLPGKVAEIVSEADLVMVPHGPATHDYNPVSTREVERFGAEVKRVVAGLEYREGGSAAVPHGKGVSVTSQLFGDTALLTYTSWPSAIDDVEYGVGHAAELHARLGGARDAFFVDCHNSLLPGAGQVFLCTPRADAILANSEEATRRALGERVGTLRVGIAQDRASFTKLDGVGDQGVQVIVVEAGRQRHAYILWDGNNAVPEVTKHIGDALSGLVDSFQVMTTDNHSVNAVAGSYGPLGHLTPPEGLAKATRAAVEKALTDLEAVESGAGRGSVEDLLVFGHQKTVQLTASINVMTSILVQILLACLTVQGLGAALLFYLVGYF